MRVYLDSSVFLSASLQNSPVSKAARRVLIGAGRRNFEAVTSVLAWDELVWIVKRKAGLLVALEEGRKFLKLPGIEVENVSLKTVSFAQDAARNFNLDPRDALHVASAFEASCDVFVSTDSDFKRVKGLKLKGVESF
ncbi:MAG: type II toxin-antitoxin system VapC family toxin [Candidatus Micrarchaeia archaeon]